MMNELKENKLKEKEQKENELKEKELNENEMEQVAGSVLDYIKGYGREHDKENNWSAW